MYRYSILKNVTLKNIHEHVGFVMGFVEEESTSVTVPSTMSGRKSRTLEHLAFDEKSAFDFFFFIWAYKSSLALYAQIKQKKI